MLIFFVVFGWFFVCVPRFFLNFVSLNFASHFLISFQRFLRFCGLFRDAFCCIPCDFTCSFNFRFFPSILLLCFTILRFCVFLSIGYMLLSFRDISWFGVTNKISTLHFAQLFPPLFTMFTSFLAMSILFFKIDLP